MAKCSLRVTNIVRKQSDRVTQRRKKIKTNDARRMRSGEEQNIVHSIASPDSLLQFSISFSVLLFLTQAYAFKWNKEKMLKRKRKSLRHVTAAALNWCCDTLQNCWFLRFAFFSSLLDQNMCRHEWQMKIASMVPNTKLNISNEFHFFLLVFLSRSIFIDWRKKFIFAVLKLKMIERMHFPNFHV